MRATCTRLLVRCIASRCSSLYLASSTTFSASPAVRRALSEPSARRRMSATTSSSAVDRVRRHQEQLDEPAAAPTTQVTRGGPSKLEELKLNVISRSSSFVVLDKGADERLDGAFDATIEKALYRDFPEVEKFRWIHQLDFATSGVMCVGVDKTATAFACRLFREKRVQKEYLAVVRGKIPFHPRDLEQKDDKPFRACTLSKLGMLIQDTDAWEKLRVQRKGSREHQRQRDYPRGPRQAPAFFNMEQARLLAKAKNDADTSITEEENMLMNSKWRDLPDEKKREYSAQSEADKKRYLDELALFLDREKERTARKRKYESLDGGDGGNTKVKDARLDSSPEPVEVEPVAYVFDDPIVEPNGGETFRMQIGQRGTYDATLGGKASTTIAFVLGHGTFEGQDVTKVLLRPLSGRRHQLRLHLAHHGFPILGDATYGDREDQAPRMMLHAWKLWLRANADEQAQFGDLFFTTSDPFDGIVKSSRDVSTITYHRDQEREQQKKEKVEGGATTTAITGK